MIFVFEPRYSGWPISGEWVALVENPYIDWKKPYVEELIDTVSGPGDVDASHASKELNRRCYMAGGKTPQEAMGRLLANELAVGALNW